MKVCLSRKYIYVLSALTFINTHIKIKLNNSITDGKNIILKLPALDCNHKHVIRALFELWD